MLLKLSREDAMDLVNLMKQNNYLYNEVIVIILTNEKATKENILGLRIELEKTYVDDKVMLFVASHGILDNELDY